MAPEYEWHAGRAFFLDRVNRQRYEADGFVLVRVSPDAGRQIHPTGLGYHSQYRGRELPPMYRHSETRLGAYGSYYPLHVPSGEQLIPSVWSCEETIRWFLHHLVEESPGADYWLQEDYPALLDRFPGGRSAITLLEHFSVWREIAQRRGTDGQQLIAALKAQCKVAAEDRGLDEYVRGIFADLTRRIAVGSTVEDFLQALERWTTNLERAVPGLMPPFCATMAQKATIYRQILTITVSGDQQGKSDHAAPAGVREPGAVGQGNPPALPLDERKGGGQ